MTLARKQVENKVSDHSNMDSSEQIHKVHLITLRMQFTQFCSVHTKTVCQVTENETF